MLCRYRREGEKQYSFGHKVYKFTSDEWTPVNDVRLFKALQFYPDVFDTLCFFDTKPFLLIADKITFKRDLIFTSSKTIADKLDGMPYIRQQAYKPGVGEWVFKILNYSTDDLKAYQNTGKIVNILAHRDLGGIGDIIMTTSVIEKGVEKYPNYKVTYACPEEFLPLLENNPFITDLKSINSNVTKKDWDVVIDLTSDCIKHEMKNQPNVKLNRPEIFAKKCGLFTNDVPRPKIYLSENEILKAKGELKDFKLKIGLVLKSNASVRNWPYFKELRAILSEKYPQATILEFCIKRPSYWKFIKKSYPVFERNLREVAALINECDVVISPDTGLAHITSALRIPTVWIFTHIDGKIRTKNYDNVWVCQNIPKDCASKGIPCWYNIPCSQGEIERKKNPPCSLAVSVEQVMKAFAEAKGYNKLFFHSNKLKLVREKQKKKIKIVVPYFIGDSRVKKAIETWRYSEVVFGITDKEIQIPKLWNNDSFFTELSTKSEKVSEKTKPFLLDLLRNLVKKYPNEDYYGFFNSDIILPAGKDIQSLVPHDGTEIVLHHRTEMIRDKNGSHLRSQKTGGCDGFIATQKTIKILIDQFPEIIVGAPWWDDGIYIWAEQKFGENGIDMRWGDIWHESHPTVWHPSDSESRFNKKTLGDLKIKGQQTNWEIVKKKAQSKQKIKETIAIIQPGRIGDIIICLPIAKYFHDYGYEVHWPVCAQYISLFNYINYANPYDIGKDISRAYKNSLAVLPLGINKIDLAIGLGSPYNKNWVDESKLSFDKWKYKQASVPFSEKCNLKLYRKYDKESELANKLGIKFDEDYCVVHSEGDNFECDIKTLKGKKIDLRPIAGFSLFDWIGILESAKAVYCIDSCVANLIEGLKLPCSKYFRPRYEQYDKKNMLLRTPSLDESWNIMKKETL